MKIIFHMSHYADDDHSLGKMSATYNFHHEYKAQFDRDYGLAFLEAQWATKQLHFFWNRAANNPLFSLNSAPRLGKKIEHRRRNPRGLQSVDWLLLTYLISLYPLSNVRESQGLSTCSGDGLLAAPPTRTENILFQMFHALCGQIDAVVKTAPTGSRLLHFIAIITKSI